MRDYITKVDNAAPSPAGILSAAEDNVRFEELKQAVVSSGQTLDPAGGGDTDLAMLAQAMARYASGGVFGVDTGGANTYVLAKVGNFVVPKTLFKPMRVIFYAGAGNTGPSTLNAFGLGIKPFYDHAGAAMSGGELASGRLVEAFYDPVLNGAAGAWKLAPWANALLFGGGGGGGGGGGTGTAIVAMPDYQSGMILSRGGATTLQVSAGVVCAGSGDVLITLATGIAKNTGLAFAAGAGNGSLDSGTIAANTWYHVWAIAKADGTSDILTSTSASAPTMPAGYTKKRIRGSFLTDSSGGIIPFVQIEEWFWWVSPARDVNITSSPIPETAQTRVLRVPPGRRVLARGTMAFGPSSQGTAIYISPLDADDTAIHGTSGGAIENDAGIPGQINVLEGSADGELSNGWFDVLTNTAAQVRSKVATTGGSHQDSARFVMATLAWRDWRI